MLEIKIFLKLVLTNHEILPNSAGFRAMSRCNFFHFMKIFFKKEWKRPEILTFFMKIFFKYFENCFKKIFSFILFHRNEKIFHEM